MNYLTPRERYQVRAFLLGALNGCLFGAMVAMALMLPYLR